MSIVISFGPRRRRIGWAVDWARPVNPAIRFSLLVQVLAGGLESELRWMVRENVNS